METKSSVTTEHPTDVTWTYPEREIYASNTIALSVPLSGRHSTSILPIQRVHSDEEFTRPRLPTSLSQPHVFRFGADYFLRAITYSGYKDYGVLLVAKVVLGKVRTVSAFKEVTSLPNGYDSVCFELSAVIAGLILRNRWYLNGIMAN